MRRFFANIPTNFDLTKKKLDNQTDANVQICKIALHNVSYSELQCNSNRAVNWRGLEPIHTVILSDRTLKNGPSPVLPSSLSSDS